MKQVIFLPYSEQKRKRNEIPPSSIPVKVFKFVLRNKSTSEYAGVM